MKKREWYENLDEVADAIKFLIKYNCCFGWNVYASEKTTCCDYTELDKEISEDFRESIRKCVERLAPSDRKDLNNQISYLLGERFHVKESTIVKILSRMMVDGDPRENKEMIAMALKIQVKQRMKLLDELLEN